MDRRDTLIKMALRLGPALLVIVSFTALLIGSVYHATNIDELQYSNPPASNFDPNVIIGDGKTNLVWFLQVTDLHLSNRGHFDREDDFKEFAKTYIDIIKPHVVLITGDITDGRIPNSTFGTAQQLDEWMAYSNAISKSGALNKTVWLDIRGNHDNFNVYRPRDPSVLYRKYSVQGKMHSRNYYHLLKADDGLNYTFIGVDEVQTPGLKIPFNFIGIVDHQDLGELREFKKISKDANSQYTVWFAHYPTSSIASPDEGLRNIIDGPYLCGHYHTIGNWITQMHATQQPGYVELELGDWKYNRRVRLSAIDHQLFNFIDFNFREFPVALMTNPKTAEYLMPRYEPSGRIAKSTHLRVLAFSNATILKVQISIDGGQRLDMKLSPAGAPLYVRAWSPDEYLTGEHKAEIYVEDFSGASKVFTQTFSLDGSKGDFSLKAKMLIRAYFKSYVMTLFYFVIIVCTLPMLALRLIAYRHKETGLKRHYRGTFLYNLHLLCNVRRIYLSLMLVPIWMAFGPSFIGYMVDEAIGICFVWGVLIDGRFLHTGITFNVSSIFLLFVHIPEVILLTYQISNTFNSLAQSNKPTSVVNLKLAFHLLLTALQCFMGSLLMSAYGLLAYLTSFQFLWCMLIYNYCWYQCSKLLRGDFIRFNLGIDCQEEQRSLTGTRARDDKSSASDQSNC